MHLTIYVLPCENIISKTNRVNTRCSENAFKFTVRYSFPFNAHFISDLVASRRCIGKESLSFCAVRFNFEKRNVCTEHIIDVLSVRMISFLQHSYFLIFSHINLSVRKDVNQTQHTILKNDGHLKTGLK